jgi:O-antigen/teichoic acid export membrane protein
MTIGKKVISSLSWLAVTRFAAQSITWIITIIVIRLLTPEDYGVMAMAMIEIGFFSLLNEMGMGSVLVQQQNLDRKTVEHVFGLLLVINIALYLLLFL